MEGASGKHARNEGGSPKQKRNSGDSPSFYHNIHNFAFSLAAHGSDKRRTTARSLLHSATLGYLTRHAHIMNKMFFFVPGIVMCFLVI